MDTRGRTRRVEERAGADRQEPQADDRAPDMDDIQRRMEEMQRTMQEMAATIADLRRQQAPLPPPPPPPPVIPAPQPEIFAGGPQCQEDHLPGVGNGGCLAYLRQFQHLRMQSFRGGVVKPREANGWMKKLQKQFDATQCPEDYKVRVATFFLEGDADDWWDEVKGRYPDDHRFSWMEFQQEFESQFYSATTREEMNMQFLKLVQGSRAVVEYAVEFRRLLKFAEHLAPTERDKVARFRTGLQPDIRALVELIDYPTLASVVSKAEQVERTQKEVSAQRAKAKASGSRNSFPPAQKGKALAVTPLSEDRTFTVCPFCQKPHRGVCRKAAGTCFKCGEEGHFMAKCPLITRIGGKREAAPGIQEQAVKKRAVVPRVYALAAEQEAKRDVAEGKS